MDNLLNEHHTLARVLPYDYVELTYLGKKSKKNILSVHFVFALSRPVWTMQGKREPSECFNLVQYEQMSPDSLELPEILFPGYGTNSNQLVPLVITLDLESQHGHFQDKTY